jgi:hypothetical protein
MQNKVLSVQQPYATLICAGVKTVENRTWKTDYRGKLLIHASGASFAYPDFNYLPKKYQKDFLDRIDRNDWNDAPQSMLNYSELLNMTYEFYGKDIEQQEPPEEWLKEAVKQYGYFLPSQSIIGECTLSDIVQNSKDDFAEPNCYHWILADPILYEENEIKKNVIGHLRLWNFET